VSHVQKNAFVMRYSYALPNNYDMSIVRQRVASKGSVFDGFNGLVFKSFLIQEVARHGRNSYGSLYLWESQEAAYGFLGGDLYQKLTDSFGRPEIDIWILPAFFKDEDLSQTRFVYQSTEIVGDREMADTWAERRGFARTPDSIARLACVNMRGWSGTVFDLRNERLGDDTMKVFSSREHEVLHLSMA